LKERSGLKETAHKMKKKWIERRRSGLKERKKEVD